MNISIIGFGNMAQAIAKGLLSDKSNRLRVAAPSLTEGVTLEGIQTHSDNLAITALADIIILAVKPAQMKSVLTEIKLEIPKKALIISVASGKTLDWLSANTAPSLAIIRAMPNIAAAIHQSATPLIANQHVTHSQKTWASNLFNTMGLTTWIEDEGLMDSFTALSGSGPAYVFLFMEAMVAAAIEQGIPEDIATSFTLQTLKGALDVAILKDKSFSNLRATVTSPAGTTAAAIHVLKTRGFDALIRDAMRAACMRSRELGIL